MAGAATSEAARQVLLVGSVPLDSAEQVFRTAVSILGTCLRRIPDGETGDPARLDRMAVERLHEPSALRGDCGSNEKRPSFLSLNSQSCTSINSRRLRSVTVAKFLW